MSILPVLTGEVGDLSSPIAVSEPSRFCFFLYRSSGNRAAFEDEYFQAAKTTAEAIRPLINADVDRREVSFFHRNNKFSGAAVPEYGGLSEDDRRLNDGISNLPNGADLLIIIRSATGLSSCIESVKQWLEHLTKTRRMTVKMFFWANRRSYPVEDPASDFIQTIMEPIRAGTLGFGCLVDVQDLIEEAPKIKAAKAWVKLMWKLNSVKTRDPGPRSPTGRNSLSKVRKRRWKDRSPAMY